MYSVKQRDEGSALVNVQELGLYDNYVFWRPHGDMHLPDSIIFLFNFMSSAIQSQALHFRCNRLLSLCQDHSWFKLEAIFLYVLHDSAGHAGNKLVHINIKESSFFFFLKKI